MGPWRPISARMVDAALTSPTLAFASVGGAGHSDRVIDLRSDTVTRPTKAMRAVMAAAEVGDDVFGDDPSVNRLQRTVADRLGFEAALFASSGTQSNLIALLAHCQRGDEYIVGEVAHTYKYEGGGAAVLGSIQPQPVRIQADGSLDLAHVESVVKPENEHFARSRLLCIENTHDGKVLTPEFHAEAAELAHDHGLRLHLDGARVWNAAVALDVDVATMTEPFDSVSLCMSKGLGAPVGSVLVGSTELIAEARKWRKMVGGGMRQAGSLAAACQFAFEHHIDRLADDHANAARLAAALAELPGVTTDHTGTNMVFLAFDPAVDGLAERLRTAGVDTLLGRQGGRLVTHLDVSDADITAAIDIFAESI
jgi:threonine aldolase